jgi:hypothetical protein
MRAFAKWHTIAFVVAMITVVAPLDAGAVTGMLPRSPR